MTEVVLRDDQSAMTLLHGATSGAVSTFPNAFSQLAWPADAAQFRHVYPDALVEFEVARLASDARLEIARQLVDFNNANVVWQGADGQQPLDRLLAEPSEPYQLNHHRFANTSAWQPNLVYRGQRYAGLEIRTLATKMCQDLLITSGAAQALQWLLDRDAEVDFHARKIVMLGAGAEMAPTKQWLSAGAKILWLDTQPPPKDWFQADSLSGELYWVESGVDLLTDPGRVKATIEAFADGEQLDLGLYAYAPGQARELKLTTVMNAIVEGLPTDLVRSVALLVSPTTPTALDDEDLANRIPSKGWQRFCAALKLLDNSAGYAQTGTAAATRTVVSIQGASYQAAQYLAKVLTAECWAAAGMRVSANTAAITRTRSLAHPVFAAAFGGAEAFGVQTLTPRQSRTLNGLLTAHDWLHPELPKPGTVRVHGGIHSLPYPLESALKIAAGIGFAKSPRLLAGLLR